MCKGLEMGEETQYVLKEKETSGKCEVGKSIWKNWRH